MSIGTKGLPGWRGRGKMHALVPLMVLLSGGLLLVSPATVGQTAGVNQAGPDYLHAPAGSDPIRQQGTSEAAAKVEQMRQAERHRRVVADTAKLQQLSNELKAEVDQAPQDQLSLDVMRKAAEIEKLAHDLKQWMKS